MTIERQWTVHSYMKRPSGALECREQSLVKESMDVITNNETLCKEGPTNLEEGTSPGEHAESNSLGDANEPWLDRHLNTLAEALGCGLLISPQAIGNGEEGHELIQPTKVDVKGEPHHHKGIPPPSSTSVDNKNSHNHDVSVLFWSQKKQTLADADNSFEQTALHSSSSEDKDSEDSRNVSKPPTRTWTKNNTFRWRLCWIIFGMLLILGVLLAVFLPNWNGRFGLQLSPALSKKTAISSPTFAPTTGKPSMAPTYGDPAIVLTFLFDDFPEEIGWQLLDSSGGMVVDDFPFLGYEPGIKAISHRIPVTMNKEYILTISDEGLDGLCCKTPGEYFVTFRGQELVSGGGNFGAQISHTFTIPEVM